MAIFDTASYKERFDSRHNGTTQEDIEEMLQVIGVSSIDELIEQTIPASIRLKKPLSLPNAKSEYDFAREFRTLANQNQVFRSYIGMGYSDTIVPPVILRNILENPAWYTAYTPYQAEIAQGRLEALINFQSMLIDLTGMEIANSSLLDESTAAAEAMSMFFSTRKGPKKNATKFFVDEDIFPQTLDVLKTRSIPIGVDLVFGKVADIDVTDAGLFGVIVQNPDNNGEIKDHSKLFNAAHENGVKCAVISDIMSMVLIKSPGEMGADVVVGNSQRFGVPMGYGGPHAAYFAAKEEFKRHIPGRIIGASVDTHGRSAYRMALQTREQHIRREKATSNICTAQVLLAVMAGMYAVYHGPSGLKKIAIRIHSLAQLVESGLGQLGFIQKNSNYFDSLKIQLPEGSSSEDLTNLAERAGINFRYFEDSDIGISISETDDISTIQNVLDVFSELVKKESLTISNLESQTELSPSLIRKSEFMTHPVFNSYQVEHEMLRYLKRLENKDLSLVHSMISLGSCTMKLNATSEMIPVSWPEWAGIHPYAPIYQTSGYQKMFVELENWLSVITGFAATSLQPNSGAQGEFSGLMVIRAYHEANGDHNRNVTLIPSSAHGTNPASAVMAGMKVIIVQCDEQGNIDIVDLRSKASDNKDNLSSNSVRYLPVFLLSTPKKYSVVYPNSAH